jgi:hypothetical protein
MHLNKVKITHLPSVEFAVSQSWLTLWIRMEHIWGVGNEHGERDLEQAM